MTTIRWHPGNDFIYYPREHQLIKRKVKTSPTFQVGPAQVEVEFRGYRIGGKNGSIKIAGGDGNDANAGRFLISLERNNNVQYTVYDFTAQKIVDQVVNLPNFTETLYSPSLFQSHLFSLPAEIDFAQVSPTGKYIVFTHNPGFGPLQLFDFSGNVYDLAYNGTASGSPKDYLFFRTHFEVGFVIAPDGGQDAVRECIIVKAIPAAVNDPNGNMGTHPGDMVAVYWYIETGQTELQWGTLEIMDWSIAFNSTGTGVAGGGQYSSVSTLTQPPVTDIFDDIPYSSVSDYPFRALIALNTVPFNPGWPPYYGEIVELSLNHHDLQPRRLIHHRITSQPSKIYQPEAWFSPDGRKVFFKSPENAPAGKEYLYFIPLPKRTCKDRRAFLGSSYRSASPDLSASHISLYPNPVSQGSIWLEADQPPEGKVMLRLISVNGSSIEVWNGHLLPGVRKKVSVHELAAGMYVAELIDQETGVSIQRQKLLIQ
ncbi:MAG: T9SS type A sorting domain-containing protein [Bacteroidota bacterium]